MLSINRFLLKIPKVNIVILSGLLFCYCSVQGQTDAGKWKTWVVQTAGLKNIASPPGKTETEKELSQLKELIGKRTEANIQKIKYWDAGSPGYRWNQYAYTIAGPELFSKPGGGNFWRAPMAWMNIAIYDAIISAWKLKYTHNRKRPFEIDPSVKPVIMTASTPSYPCEHAVTAAAAATVLAYFFPDQKNTVMQMAKEDCDSRLLAGVQFPSDVKDGWKLGEEVANSVIEQAKKDRSEMAWTGKIPTDPLLWRGNVAVGAITVNIQPILLKSADQFRPGPPPDFKKEMEEMKNFKQNFYTASQAYYWASVSGLDVWTDLASKKIFEYNIEKNVPLCAQVYTLLHVALHDVAIAIMDAKYAYFGIRPNQYDSEFKPLIGFTPPFPGYPSGHATASSACATVLSYFFPADEKEFRKAAKDCADSRFYAGIHFTTDNKVGLEMGEKVGNYIIKAGLKEKY